MEWVGKLISALETLFKLTNNHKSLFFSNLANADFFLSLPFILQLQQPSMFDSLYTLQFCCNHHQKSLKLLLRCQPFLLFPVDGIGLQ